jgi:hypothetical protein
MYTEGTVNFFYQYFDMKFIQITLTNKKLYFYLQLQVLTLGGREELAV